jgi:RNA recognition motif-containing protein
VAKKLYCGNLSYNVSSSQLEQLFSEYGSVESAQVISDRDTGRSKGFGFVEMESDGAAQAALDGLNETEHDGRRLIVNEARPREDRRRGGGGYGRD